MHYTRNVLRAEPIPFKGDPMQDFALLKYGDDVFLMLLLLSLAIILNTIIIVDIYYYE